MTFPSVRYYLLLGKKYAPKLGIFIVGVYLSSLLNQLFDPWNVWLISSLSGRASKYYVEVINLLSFNVPVYLLIEAATVSFFVWKIYRHYMSKYRTLYILEAVYGANGRYVDIANALNARVSSDKLRAILDNSIAGDPIPGVRKKALLRYRFKDVEYSAEFVEGNVMDIPNHG